VNIHFTSAQPGELDELAGTGARRVRVDFDWAATEQKPGVYDFSAYQRLSDDLAAHGLRPWFVLDYENPLYEPKRAVATPAGRAAFARWAAAAAAAWRGQGVIWEIWNEPNSNHTWQPQPDASAYIALAQAATTAIKQADPNAIVVGPATALIDLDFLRACGEAGLFNLWDGISVHPYRREAPETAAAEYRQARGLVRKYTAPGRPPPPLIAGEWGYSTAWFGLDEDFQAAYAARLWLVDLAAGVPLTMWYDWRDDGDDFNNPEHHYGLVHHLYRTNLPPVFEPKPAEEAVAALAHELRFYRFNKALTHDDGFTHLLLFDRMPDAPAELPPYKLALWTTRPDGPDLVDLPIGPGTFHRVDGRGRPQADAQTANPSLRLPATALPQYITPEQPSPRLVLLAAWETWPNDVWVEVGAAPLVHSVWPNPLDTSIEFIPALDPAPSGGGPEAAVELPAKNEIDLESNLAPEMGNDAPARIRAGVEGWWQESWLLPARELEFALTPFGQDGAAVSVANAPGDRLDVRAGEDSLRAEAVPGQVPVVHLPAPDFDDPDGVVVTAGLTDPAGRLLAQEILGRVQPVRLPDGPRGSSSTLRAAVEGGDYPMGTGECRWDDPPAGVPGAPAALVWHAEFSTEAGANLVRFAPTEPAGLPVWPHRVGFWVCGNGTPVRLTLRLRDVSGQVFQPRPVPITGRGWQPVWLNLDPAQCEHSGGQNDGVPHPGFAWDCYFLLDTGSTDATKGDIYLLPPTLEFPQE
jgi:hypothetical protein